MSLTTFIYGLVDPRTQYLRYIGKSNRPEVRRWRHNCADGTKNHRTDWLRSLKKERLKPELFIIEQVPMAEWEEAERFWICYFKGIGCPLVNGTSGGDGGKVLTQATREKLRSIALARGPHSEETKRKMSEAHKGNKYRLGKKGKHLRRPDSIETRFKKSASHKGKRLSEHHAKNMARGIKAWWDSRKNSHLQARFEFDAQVH